MDPISSSLAKHYSATFEVYGPNSQGVDWGDKEWAAELRNRNMLNVVNNFESSPTLLDVGCGYGALGDLIKQNGIKINYHGIDVAANMINYAENKFSTESKFFCMDFLEWQPECKYDYIVCNGILTQKLQATHLEMHEYAKRLIRKMFDCASVGIAFNCMSTYVNFQKDNLFYKNPSEILAWCMSELSPHVRLDASYELWYEYTVYVYHGQS
jgi:SAM-dependent methyltransferase